MWKNIKQAEIFITAFSSSFCRRPCGVKSQTSNLPRGTAAGYRTYCVNPIRNNKLFLVLSAMLVMLAVLHSCSYPEKPPGATGDPGSGELPGEHVSIAYLKSLYSGHPLTITGNYMINGVVISTDRYGNFHKTLAIRDETAAIEIRIDSEELFGTFHVGATVEVHCNTLTLGAYGGVVQLGTRGSGGFEVGYIEPNILAAHLKITGSTEERPEPLHLPISGLSASHISQLIRFSDVQFIGEEMGLSWCDEDADTDRTLEDAAGNRLKVRTSHRAEFAGQVLPQGSGYLEGIVSSFNDTYQLRVVDTRRVRLWDERFQSANPH